MTAYCQFCLSYQFFCTLCLPEKVQHLSSADLAVLEQMKDTIDSQRDVIRSKDIEIQSTREDLEAVSIQKGMACAISMPPHIYLTL